MNYRTTIDDCFKKTKMLLNFVSSYTLLHEAQQQQLWQAKKVELVKTANEVITTINTILMDKPSLKFWAGHNFDFTVSKLNKMRELADITKDRTPVSRMREVAVNFSRGLL